MRLRASVATSANLPTANNFIGDVRRTLNNDNSYIWASQSSSGILSDWVLLGGKCLLEDVVYYIGNTGNIYAVSMNAAGEDYEAYDTVVVTGGDANAVLTIDSVDGDGAVTGFTITGSGSSYSTGTGIATTTSGAGSGFTIDITSVVSGSDVTGDGTWAKPFATIKHTLSLIPKNIGSYNAVIFLLDGSYVEDAVNIAGFYGGGIQILAASYDRTKVLIEGTGTSWTNIFEVDDSNASALLIAFMSLRIKSDYMSCIYGGCANLLVVYGILVGDDGIATNTYGVSASSGDMEISELGDIDSNKVTNGLASWNDSIVFLQANVNAGDTRFIRYAPMFDNITGFLLTKETAPTQDYEVANKKYVDDKTAGGATGGSDSAGVGKQYITLTINGVVYKLLHDGIVTP